MTVSISGTGGLTFNDNSVQDTAATGFGFKNRIINGAMVIDQRNAGASVTPTSTSTITYTLDRWGTFGSQASKFSVQQNAAAVTPPAGFTNYLGVTSLSAYSVLTADIFFVGHIIEGFNAADFAWGTANAQAVTLSFWVRSSLTGTFGGAVQNSANSRSYPFAYTISAANTWEQKTVTIPGDTTGTWLTDSGRGVVLRFGLGVGSTSSGTAGAWAAADFRSATGATSVVGTNGATFYITGVELAKGSTATSFDYRPIGTELGLCQRYFAKLQNDGTGADVTLAMGMQQGTTGAFFCVKYPVTMRTEPTATISGLAVGDQISFTNAATIGSTFPAYDTSTITVTFAAAGAQYRPIGLLILNNTAGFIAFSAEL